MFLNLFEDLLPHNAWKWKNRAPFNCPGGLLSIGPHLSRETSLSSSHEFLTRPCLLHVVEKKRSGPDRQD